MSSLTLNDTRGLMEAYASVHDSKLRANLEEKNLVEELGFEIIENAAYVLFSQGYAVKDLCDYFEEANTDIIAEDFVGFTEGKAYLSESLMAPKEYVEEQFRQLNEVAGLVRGAINLGSKVFGAGAGAMKGGAGAKGALGAMAKSTGRSFKQGLQAAGQFAKTKMGQIGTALKGAAKAAPTALKGAVKGAAKIGSKALPGVGAALYGMDAASRFKKGDWGGGLLSTAGAVTSLVPGAGLVAGLAPAAVQMGTDALGLTGDKSKKGSFAKTTPAAPKPPKGAGYVDVPGKGKRYFASSDQKYYKNYNDALAARNSRLGKKPAPAAPPTPVPASTPSSTSPSAKAAPTKPATGKLGSTTFERRTPTSAEFKAAQEYRSANPNAKPEDVLKAAQEGGKRQASVDMDLAKANTSAELNKKAPPGTALAKEQERREEEKRKRAAETAGTTAESYDAYNIVLDYLFANGHADTLSEAHYVMMQMDSEYIRDIVENVQSGPILPMKENGKKVYPMGQEPKATGAKLPKLPLA
jgi:hypothetical protein